MNFKIDRELLLENLTNVSRGLSTKTPMPILTGVLLLATESSLTMITTNKEISVKIELPVSEKLEIESAGECVVPGKYFLDIVRKIEGTTIEFALFDQSTIKIVSERSDFTLVAYDRNDFPNYSFSLNGDALVFKSAEMKKIIRQTTFATSISETRVILTSVNFKIVNNHLTITATDSFRLSKKELDLDVSVPDIQINVPGSSLNELEKILDDSNEELKLQIENNKALFMFKNVCFMSRLVEGNYPDTSSLYPKDFLLTVTFNKDEIISAVDRAALFANLDSMSLVKFSLNNTNCIEISSNSTEVGKVVEEVYPINVSELQIFQIAFSTKYLMDALKAFDSNKITFYFTGEIKPAVICGESEKNLTQLLLPVRVF